MTMNDTIRTIIAATLEIGTPVGLLLAYKFLPGWRKRLIVILGSLTPISATLTYVGLAYLLGNGKDPDAEWAFGAMWVMSFVVFVLSVLIGVILALLKKPVGLIKRYFLGLIVPLIFAGVEYLHKHNHLPF